MSKESGQEDLLFQAIHDYANAANIGGGSLSFWHVSEARQQLLAAVRKYCALLPADDYARMIQESDAVQAREGGRIRPKWYKPGAPMNIGDALRHLDDVEPDGSAAAYQDALEAIHTHIRRMGAEYTELSTRYAALFGAVERARAELAPANVAPLEGAPQTFHSKLATAEELHGSGNLPAWTDEQFAKAKAALKGFAPGQPECTTCERRVQEGEQPPFPTVQARQWINRGGRVWSRLCEACRKVK